MHTQTHTDRKKNMAKALSVLRLISVFPSPRTLLSSFLLSSRSGGKQVKGARWL